jgi:hypothetical protein
MPGYDGTGPGGTGPLTGGGRGFCAGSVNGTARRPRFGRGGGNGRRNIYRATGLTGWQRAGVTPLSEKEVLKEEADFLRGELADIQSRIVELGKNNKE